MAAVVDGMLEGCTIVVKVLHVAYDLSHPTGKHTGSRFDLFEAVVGDGEKEYVLISTGESNASVALEKLQGMAEKVVRMSSVNHKLFRKIDQLELKGDIDVRVIENPDSRLARQRLCYTQIAALGGREDRSRVNVENAIVHIDSECKFDKNNEAYRAVRLVDSHGKGVMLKAWGSVAEKEEVWRKNAVVKVVQTTINKKEHCMDLRCGGNIYRIGVAGKRGLKPVPANNSMVDL